MKKIILSTLLAGTVAFANGTYGEAGCGLGSMLIADNEGFPQVFASTTNSTSGSQTFGITSGTSNCGESKLSSNDTELYKFMKNNMDELAMNISQGEGEYLDTLAKYLDTDSATLAKTLKSNFDKIYTKDDIKVSEVMDNIHTVINS